MSQNLRTGKNPKLFNRLESIQNINRMQPLLDGGRDMKLGNYEGSVWGKKSRRVSIDVEDDDKQDEDLDTEDEEERNRCFFE